ncbi:MAG: hypothetical protein PHG00_05355 [Methylococcales bacterium]|nr:hypothetical protein [Methylococcales bacterium]
MRFLLKVNIPVESGNQAAKAGKLGATVQSILADMKPEAVYFTDNNGHRAGFIFLEMQDASQIPPSLNRGSSRSMPASRFIRSCYPRIWTGLAVQSRWQSKNMPDRGASFNFQLKPTHGIIAVLLSVGALG